MNARAWPAKLHRAVDTADRRIGSRLRSNALTAAAWTRLLDTVVSWQPDRVYMRKTILPALAAAAPRRILFVGVRGYTRSYGKAFRGLAVEFWTSDIDPAAARYGAPNRHVTEDLRALDLAFPPGFFDVVMINGVLGWGVDGEDEIRRALAAAGVILAEGGVLLLGWNAGSIPDPDMVAGLEAFRPASFAALPQRMCFDAVTHIYAWYQKGFHDGSGATGVPT